MAEETIAQNPPARQQCAIQECNRPARSQGLCVTHYGRAYRRRSIPIAHKVKDKVGSDFLALTIEVGKTRTERAEECLIWPFRRQSRGYAVLHGQGEAELVSRIVCQAMHGPALETAPWALHNCDNGKGGCIEPTHIEWGSPRKNNIDDRIRAGTYRPWVEARAAKLTKRV